MHKVRTSNILTKKLENIKNYQRQRIQEWEEKYSRLNNSRLNYIEECIHELEGRVVEITSLNRKRTKGYQEI